MGGGLAAPALSPSPGRGAPDRAELLPRQAIGGRDAAAQDAATDSLRARDHLQEVSMSEKAALVPRSSGWPPKCLSKKIPSLVFNVCFF